MATKRAVLPHPSDASLAIVQLANGGTCVISVEDASEVGQFNWSSFTPTRITYAHTCIPVGGGKYKWVTLHRLVASLAGFGTADEIDHEDGNGLNCARTNLRPATHADNNRNKIRMKTNTSGYIGVDWHKRAGKWRARLKGNNGKEIHLGLFVDIIEAARARDRAAVDSHGPFAVLNFPTGATP